MCWGVGSKKLLPPSSLAVRSAYVAAPPNLFETELRIQVQGNNPIAASTLLTSGVFYLWLSLAHVSPIPQNLTTESTAPSATKGSGRQQASVSTSHIFLLFNGRLAFISRCASGSFALSACLASSSVCSAV
jgi:hypothetical protein